MNIKIYHNPQCSKSRATLDILKQQNDELEIIQYLKNPPTAQELKQLLLELGIKAKELLRTGGDLYKELDLANKNLNEDELIKIMLANPKLIERPIVKTNKGVVIARPPQKVLNIL